MCQAPPIGMLAVKSHCANSEINAGMGVSSTQGLADRSVAWRRSESYASSTRK